MAKPSAKYTTAFGAIASAAGVILLMAGYYLRVGEFVFFFLASVAAMPLLYYGNGGAFVLSFSVTSALALVFSGFNFIYVFPYIVLFGWYPLLRWLLVRTKMPEWATRLMRIAVFETGMILMWRFTALFTVENEIINRYMLLIVAVAGIIVYFPYDEAIRRLQLHINRFIAKGRWH